MSTKESTVTPLRDGLTFEQRMAARAERKAKLAAAEKAKSEADMIKFDELEQQHGDGEVRAVWTSAGMVVIKKPKRSQVDAFQEMYLRDGKEKIKAANRLKAAEKLAKECLVHPDGATYESWCEEYGGIPSNVGAEAAKFADVVLNEEAEKL